MDNPLPFAQGAEVNDYKWTSAAYDLMVEGKLVVKRRNPSRSVVAIGACPRCAHDVDYTFLPNISLPRGGRTTLGRGPTKTKSEEARPTHCSGQEEDDVDQYDTVPILCRCRDDHPGRPEGARGCGITFNTELLRE